MKIFLTGATGFIGSAVAARLKRGGHEVMGLARSKEAEAKLRGMGVGVHRGDLLEPESLLPAVEASDGVVNTGSARAFEPDRGDVERAAVLAMLGVMEGTGKPFLYTSDQLIYGDTGEADADEDTEPAPPPFLAWRARLEWEVLAFAERGVRAMVIRPVAIYGHGRGGLTMFVDAAKARGASYYVGDGENRWSFVHVDDVADLYARMLAEPGAPAGTLLNGAGPASVAMKDFMGAVGRAAGLDGARSLSLEEAREKMGPVPPPEFFTSNLRVSATRAAEVLGWRPEPQRPSIVDDLERGSYRDY